MQKILETCIMKSFRFRRGKRNHCENGELLDRPDVANDADDRAETSEDDENQLMEELGQGTRNATRLREIRDHDHAQARTNVSSKHYMRLSCNGPLSYT